MFMNTSVSVREVSKCYRLGVLSHQTLVDEIRHLSCKLLGRDIRAEFGKLGHSATEARRVAVEQSGQDEFWALKDVSFEIQQGEVVGIIGRNGAGKSTLLKILSRITEPTQGEVDIYGRVASLLEVGTGFHPELTGRENVYMNGTILGMKTREITTKFDEIVEFSGLAKFIDTPVKRYSSGMYVRLAFAVAAHLEPEILLVDEVLAVGDMEFQKKCLGKMQGISESGRTILFVSHNMSAVNRLCSRGILLDGGQVVKEGLVHEVTTFYQKASAVEDGERLWSTDTAPGTDEVRLMGVSLYKSDSATVTLTLSVHDAARLVVRYRTNRPELKFRCCAAFKMNDTTAFWSLEPFEQIREKPGDYVSEVEIPSHLLNEGEYTVGIFIFPAIGVKQVKYGYVKEYEVIRFQVYDPLTGESARGDYIKEFPGFVRPFLRWTLRKDS